MNEHKSNVVLECKDLRISFTTLSGTVKAVRGISFDLERGKTLAIVGESGSGKSVTSRAILGILANNKIVEGGQILYDGKDLLQLSEEQFTSIRGSKISMIFQDPLSSLNPIMKVGKQLTEPMFLKAKATRKEAKKAFKKYLSNLSNSLKTYANGNEGLLNAVKALSISRKAEATLINKKFDVKIAKLGDDAEKNAELIEKLNNERNALKDLSRDSLEVAKQYFVDESNKNSIIDILNESYKLYVEKLHLLRQSLIDFKNNSFNTSSDYKKNILAIYKQIDDLIDERITKNKEFYDKISALDKENTTEISTLAAQKKEMNSELETKINSLRAEALKVIEFEPKAALKAIKDIQKQISECDYPYSVENEDIVSVFATSFKKYILDYIQAIELNEENTKFLNSYLDYNKGIKNEIPAKVRAKRREIIVPFYEFYEKMVNSLDSIIDYIKKECIDVPFDAEIYYNSFVEAFNKQERLAATKVKKSEAKKRALELLEEVGIPEPERRYYQYPFEFSGGMRQRIVIAIALSSNPEILICDEPTTALDVTIQAQILELINKMKVEHNLSIIFITHDLGVVANMADDIAVMYAGKIVEKGTVYDIFYDPRHPYTWALLGSMPDLDTKDKLEAIPGTPPNMLLPPKGDAFAARNKYAMKIDYKAQPPFFKVSDTHSAATWLLHEDAPSASAPKVVIERIKNSLARNSANKPIYTNSKNSILEEGGNE